MIRQMSIAPRIHGELLKLGIDVGQTSVAKYMARRSGPPSQGWKTFLRNHADGIAAMDLFVVPTVSFRLLYCLLIIGHGRRQILWIGVTAHPTAEWIANQLTGPLAGSRCLDILSAIVTQPTVRYLFVASNPWVFGIARRLLGHPGRTATRSG